MNSRLVLLAFGAALIAPHAQAATVDLVGRPIDLALNPITLSPDLRTLGGQAELTTNLLSFATRLQLGLETGPGLSADQARTRWNGSQMNFGAVWSPNDRARLELSAGGQRRRDLELPSLTDPADARREVSTQDSQARAAAVISPLSPISLTVGGEAVTRAVRTDAAADVANDQIMTRSQTVFSSVSWRLSPMLQFEGGARLQSLGVDWAGAGAGQGDYRFVEPGITGALTPWDGGAWRLSYARVVEPLNTDQFVGFAKAAPPAERRNFAPDQAWRWQANFSQSLWSDAALSATLTQSHLQNVTDFAPAGLTEAPMSIGGGQRQEVEGIFATPINLLGVHGTTLKARTAWRRSEVRDPFTGQTRRASGETPYEAQLSVTQALAGMNWGVTAQAQGPVSTWQMSQVVTRSANAGLGAFVEYAPGPLKVRLNLDNVVGGERLERTTYYSGSRAYGQVDGLDQTRTADRVIGLTLTRALQ